MPPYGSCTSQQRSSRRLHAGTKSLVNAHLASPGQAARPGRSKVRGHDPHGSQRTCPLAPWAPAGIPRRAHRRGLRPRVPPPFLRVARGCTVVRVYSDGRGRRGCAGSSGSARRRGGVDALPAKSPDQIALGRRAQVHAEAGSRAGGGIAARDRRSGASPSRELRAAPGPRERATSGTLGSRDATRDASGCAPAVRRSPAHVSRSLVLRVYAARSRLRLRRQDFPASASPSCTTRSTYASSVRSAMP